ncbi:Asp-tRNA(Asn)/Glu-tRNA(Gln) amidotransferase subunit GatC [Lacticaseibacillus sp. GG6-2]
MITKQSVAHVAELARLAFNEDELQQFTAQLDDILNMVDQLEEVDTTGVATTTQSIHLQNVMREDKAVNNTPTEDLFKNVPTSKGTLIQVPAIIDKEED